MMIQTMHAVLTQAMMNQNEIERDITITEITSHTGRYQTHTTYIFNRDQPNHKMKHRECGKKLQKKYKCYDANCTNL